MTFENQTTVKGIRNIQPAGRVEDQKKPEEIEISNRFESLQTNVSDEFEF